MMPATALIPKEATRALARLEDAKRALESASAFDEFQQIAETAGLFAAYARKARLGLDAQNAGAEIKIRAERRMGEVLTAMEKNRGAASPTRLHDATTLEDLGVEKTQSHRWQRISSIPEEDFEQFIEKTKEDEQELTSSAVYKLATRLAKGESEQEPATWTLFDATEGLRKAVLRIQERWPAEFLSSLGHQLKSLGDEILEHGGLSE